jgi:putative transposase
VDGCLPCDLAIERPSQASCADVTCIPMRRGFPDRVCIIGRASRPVLTWRISNSQDAELRTAPARYCRPEMFDTGQGSRLTRRGCAGLKASAVQLSAGGRGPWMGDVFIEWIWRSLKYEHVSRHSFEIGNAARVGTEDWIGWHNGERPYSALVMLTPNLPGAVLVSRGRSAASSRLRSTLSRRPNCPDSGRLWP